jgi:hypothetical protein
MKKVTLIVVSLLLTLFSYSQDFSRVLVASKSEWNGTEWKTVATNKPTDMFVIMKGWDITIGEYKFRTYDEPQKTTYENHVTYTWKCINGDGVKCIFMMKKFKPEVSSHMLYSVLYSESLIMFDYETEN